MVAWRRTVGEGVWRARLSQYYCRAFGSAVLEPVRIRRWSGGWSGGLRGLLVVLLLEPWRKRERETEALGVTW